MKTWRMVLLISFSVCLCVLTALYAFNNDLPRQSGLKLDAAAFSNVALIDVHSGQAVPGQTILIENGLIAAIGDSAALVIPNTAMHFDMAGQYAIPGLWDMHIHFPRLAEHFGGPMMVMSGVFYGRNMSAHCYAQSCTYDRPIEEVRALVEAVNKGDLLAPFMVRLGSHLIHGPAVGGDDTFYAPADEAAAKQLVEHLTSIGADFLKPYDTLEPRVYSALAREARRAGLAVEGHVPKALTLRETLAAGQRSIEHGRMLPLACSDFEQSYADLYAAWLKKPDGKPPYLPRYYDQLLANPNEDACQAVLEQWAKAGAYYIPTHVTRQSDFLIADKPYERDLRADYVPLLKRKMVWDEQSESFSERIRENDGLKVQYKAFFERGLALTNKAHKAGVTLLVGTDAGDTLIYSGPSFHDEMALYQKAGLSPADILKAATVRAAEFTGLDKTHGTLEVGKVADIVFLDQNPLDDIRHTASIDSLVFNHRFYDAGERAKIRSIVKSKANGIRHWLTVGWTTLTRFLPALAVGQLGGDGLHLVGHAHAAEVQ